MQIGNKEYKTRQLTPKDAYCMLFILVLYTILSFFHLGSLENPQTFWQPEKDEQEVVLDLGEEKEVSKIRYYSGARVGTFELAISSDQKVFIPLTDLEEKKVFFWKDQEVNKTFRYLKVLAKGERKGSIGEIGLYDKQGNLLTLTSLTADGNKIIDEQATIPEQISYMNSTYFDEIYHARTAYEYIQGMPIYEWTHPPLGKLIMTIPIRILGMTPFSYRLMGNLAGILMLIVIYIFAKRMFQETRYAGLAMFLFAVDGMHFVQTRIGTVDSFLVLFIMLAYLFMYQYICCATEKEHIKMHINLCLSGIFMGAAIATKWNGAYAALGLALIFFINFIKRNKEGYFISTWKQKRKQIIAGCFIYFIFIPLIIYLISYLPDMKINAEYGTLKGFINLQQRMYRYHSQLEATHPFSSNWYLWPLGIKPLWYYNGQVEAGSVSSIALHSNPFIWWTGIVAMLYTFAKAIIERQRQYIFATIAILTTYLPYMFIPRIMFIYHYFPVIPFMILTIVGTIRDLEKTTGHRWYKSYSIIALIVFLFFYPIYSGFVVPEWYAQLTEWLPMWQLY